MSPATFLLPFFTWVFYKKIVRWRSRKKWKLRVRHVSQQESSIKGNYSAALGIHQKETNTGFTALVSYFGWIRYKNKSELSCPEERAVLSHVPRDSDASGWDGSVPWLPPPFATSPCARSVYTRETHYPQLFVFSGPVLQGCWPWLATRVPAAAERQSRGTAGTALPEHGVRMIHGPFTAALTITSEPHHWELLLGVSAV